MTDQGEPAPDPEGYYPDDITEIMSNAKPEKKELLRGVAKIIVEGDRYDLAMDWLEDCLLEAGVGHEATTGLLFGPPGVGKSTALRRFMNKYGKPMETKSGTKRTVARVVTPSNPNLGNFLDAMLNGLGAGAVLGGKIADKKIAVKTQIERQGIKLIMFDEFTHVIEDKSQAFAKNVAREVKEMLSEGRCQCVLAGTVELQGLHGIYSQFRRRSGGDHYIAPFAIKDKDDVAEWILAMSVIDEALPIKSATSLHDEEMALKLLHASDGVMDNLMKLLFRATSFAYDEGKLNIGKQHLADAFQRMRRGDIKTNNPFGHPKKRAPRPRLASMDDSELDEGWTGMHVRKDGPEHPKRKEGPDDSEAVA